MRAAQLDVIVSSSLVLGDGAVASFWKSGDGGDGVSSSFWDADVCVTVTIDLEAADKIFLRYAGVFTIVELIILLLFGG